MAPLASHSATGGGGAGASRARGLAPGLIRCGAGGKPLHRASRDMFPLALEVQVPHLPDEHETTLVGANAMSRLTSLAKSPLPAEAVISIAVKSSCPEDRGILRNARRTDALTSLFKARPFSGGLWASLASDAVLVLKRRHILSGTAKLASAQGTPSRPTPLRPTASSPR